MDRNGESWWQVCAVAAAWALAGAGAGPLSVLAGVPASTGTAAGVCAALCALAGAALELELW